MPGLERAGIPFEWLTPGDASQLFPSVAVDDLYGVLYEPDAGVLHARRATQVLVEDGERRGVRRLATRLAPADDPPADVVVWACGAWLPGLFDFVPVTVERRDELFLGGDRSWVGTPGWVDYDAGFYGHGDVAGLGVKVAGDSPSEQIDPDTLDRLPSPVREREARDYAAKRFPSLAGAPVTGARVCQYDLTPDTHFVVTRHPERESWWLVGGGSGHGFKHGPALGDYVADCVEGLREPEPFLRLGERAGNAGLRTGTR
jgi:glycine/D-amino acid oxidase-like deaminating enzyme